ncbi:hypothetical protein GW884_02550, partial [Candidatus Falkowbacteria bacterium]|nr:hypothetical protein [Candidatus Falkowbacteria bacterium]
QKTKAQQIPNFEELQNFQIQSAKIKFSFAIGEKKAEFTPILEEFEAPVEVRPPQIETVTPSEEGVEFLETKKSANFSGSWESRSSPIVLGLSPTSSIADQETLSSPLADSLEHWTRGDLRPRDSGRQPQISDYLGPSANLLYHKFNFIEKLKNFFSALIIKAKTILSKIVLIYLSGLEKKFRQLRLLLCHKRE